MLCCAMLCRAVIVKVKKCLSIKGAEDAINKPHAFEVSTTDCSMFFIADSDKVGLIGVDVHHMADKREPQRGYVVLG